MSIISFREHFSLARKRSDKDVTASGSHPNETRVLLYPPGLPRVTHWPPRRLPRFVQHSPVAMRYFDLLKPLDWERLPWQPTGPRPGPRPASPLPYIAAFLVKLNQQIPTIGSLRQFLVEQPALTWLLGFPLQQCRTARYGFDVASSLPSPGYFSHVLRTLPNPLLQCLLGNTVTLLQVALPPELPFAQAISLDTKVVIAWVKENNPKAYVKEGRYDKERQPSGDKDCRVRCKRRRNVSPEMETTPTKEGQPAEKLGVGKGEFYWGYASGIVVTKVAGWGEFVLAELTQSFDRSDISYFYPLMETVEARLGFRPPYGTMDAAYDAFYTHEYFQEAGGFAAIPLVERSKTNRQFTEDGLPLCAAGLAMPLKGTFINRTSLVVHERGRYACPLLYPQPDGGECPVAHANWPAGGCLVTLPTSIGTRLRLQLDRQSDAYKQLYKQRTASERIFAQATELGIARPKLRNRCSIANQNTLTYVLINLRAYHRVCKQRGDNA